MSNSNNPAAPTRSGQATGYATVEELIQCLRAWNPEMRVVGNVKAGTAVKSLNSMLSELTMLRQQVQALKHSEGYWIYQCEEAESHNNKAQ